MFENEILISIAKLQSILNKKFFNDIGIDHEKNERKNFNARLNAILYVLSENISNNFQEWALCSRFYQE